MEEEPLIPSPRIPSSSVGMLTAYVHIVTNLTQMNFGVVLILIFASIFHHSMARAVHCIPCGQHRGGSNIPSCSISVRCSYRELGEN